MRREVTQKMRSNIVTVVFSKDRSMQLDLTLTSYEQKAIHRSIGHEYVIYKASDERFEKSYLQVEKEHPNFKFIKEDIFKLDLFSCLKGHEYILFIVDDCIFTEDFSFKKITSYLDIYIGAIGFSLRLGKNTKYCYSLGIDNAMPEFAQPLGSEIIGFNWSTTGPGDFSYPLEVSSSVYRISDIKPVLEGIHYSNPNQLEWILYNYIPNLVIKPFLLSYEKSVAFCNPINRVQTENNNRAGVNPCYSIENLLILYEAGYRINNLLFEGFTSNACHQEVDIDFIKLKETKNEYR